jgi:hypothetical protein
MMLLYVLGWAPYLAALGRGARIAGRHAAVVLARRMV